MTQIHATSPATSPAAGPGQLMAIFFISFVGMVGCEATMRLPDNHGTLSINTLGISQISLRLRGGTNNEEREAKINLGLSNATDLAPIFLIVRFTQKVMNQALSLRLV